MSGRIWIALRASFANAKYAKCSERRETKARKCESEDAKVRIEIIGDYEATYEPGGEPALVLHHVVQGFDAARLGANEAAALRELLAIRQKRIRALGPYQAIFGAEGDFALYAAGGRRACYLTSDQAAMLARLLAR